MQHHNFTFFRISNGSRAYTTLTIIIRLITTSLARCARSPQQAPSNQDDGGLNQLMCRIGVVYVCLYRYVGCCQCLSAPRTRESPDLFYRVACVTIVTFVSLSYLSIPISPRIPPCNGVVRQRYQGRGHCLLSTIFLFRLTKSTRPGWQVVSILGPPVGC